MIPISESVREYWAGRENCPQYRRDEKPGEIDRSAPAPAPASTLPGMTDRELLELAAKAVGYVTTHPMNAERMKLDPPVDALWVQDQDGKCRHTGWNPLESDGDALRLANKLRINIQRETLLTDPTFPPSVHCGQCGLITCEWAEEPEGEDADSACRRAIVRAAAEIGKAMP